MKRQAVYVVLACGLATPIPFLLAQAPAAPLDPVVQPGQPVPPVMSVDVFSLLAQKSH